jgi:hypothetical protein
MFGLGKKSKPALAQRIRELSVDAAEQFHEYLKEDPQIYSKCININPIKNTSALFMMNIYRDMLNCKYHADDVFVVINTAVFASAPDRQTGELFWHTLIEYMQSCNQGIEYYSQFAKPDIPDVLTKVFFALVIDDREFLQNELDDSIPQSVSYRKIYNYIGGVLKHRSLLNERFNLRLK